MKARSALIVVSLFGGLQSSLVFAAANLKQIQVADGEKVEISFDSKIKENQVQVEYLRDIIQLTLTDVNVYPARVSSVTTGDLRKVFAYQYSPKTVRCRLSVNGNAEDFKRRFQLKLTGKTLSMKFSQPVVAAQAVVQAPVQALDDGEKKLLDKVMKRSEQNDKEKSDTKKIKTKKAQSDELEISSETSRVPSPIRIFGMLGLVIALFAACAVGVKKWRDRNLGNSGSTIPRGLKGMLTQALSQKLGKNKKLIEIVANHYLGPKKSISVVKIQGRTLVLGVSQDSINLIAQLPNDASADDIDLESFAQSSIQPTAAIDALGAAPFSQILASAQPVQATRPRSNVRDRIRKEVETLKTL